MNELRRYERPPETNLATAADTHSDLIPFADAATKLSNSSLSPGSKKLLLGLLRTGSTRVFPGGGIGIEYGSLLKTAVRPDDIGDHVRAAAEHLIDRKVDLLLVPGMSGYPVGAMYALAANIPAVLLKKQELGPEPRISDVYPPGSFAIPSYTGNGDVVMSADPEAMRDIIESIVAPQIAAETGKAVVNLVVRCAGGDDIIDKAVMAKGITECAPLVCQSALSGSIARYRRRSGDERPMTTQVDVVAWVTPLIKTYNQPKELLKRLFGIEPFGGISVTSVQFDPWAIGVEGAGLFEFAPAGD